tara:strand:+ start:119 stop:883 length:765 start_codon:yes stop_codon:yes gene_type:complete
MTYQEQLLIVNSIPIKEGERKIMTCPSCGGYKKFSLKKEDGSLLWNCFRASCNVKGVSKGRIPIHKVKAIRDNQPLLGRVGKPLPEITTLVENYDPAIDYLKSVNSLEAYKNNLVDIKYSPSDERVVFYGTNGAVGRTLKPYGPKWVTYGDVSDGITVGTGDTAILVEDTPSACSISRIPNTVGISMCGTTLTSNINSNLNQYTNVYLMLDRDASNKSIKIVKNQNRNVKMRIPPNDLKYLTKDQIKGLLFLDQ